MWRYIAAQAIGESHRRLDLVCQDRLACTVLNQESLVAVVADGAGSAPLADRGAEIAVRCFVDYVDGHILGETLDLEALMRSAAVFARTRIEEDAREQGASIAHYATTLLAVLVTPTAGGAIQIGDGVIVVNNGGAEWDWVFWPQRGEFVNTTSFLTDQDALERLEVDVFPSAAPVVDVAVLSDGLERLALNHISRTVHSPFFNGFLKELLAVESLEECGSLSTDLKAFLSSARVRAQTNDDVSLVVATRRKYERPQ
jgi:hypothetical protein